MRKLLLSGVVIATSALYVAAESIRTPGASVGLAQNTNLEPAAAEPVEAAPALAAAPGELITGSIRAPDGEDDDDDSHSGERPVTVRAARAPAALPAFAPKLQQAPAPREQVASAQPAIPAPAKPKPIAVAATSVAATSVAAQPVAAPKPVVTAPAPAVARGLYKDGSYRGPSADAYFGQVQVQANVAGGRVVSVDVLSYPSDRRTSRAINARALPRLQTEAIQAQTANVDIVSGATLTSRAYRKSLAQALAQARG